ncbi:MAG: HAD family phosphatase [Acidobacteriota bacterium]
MLRAILFDFNGVLVDDEPVHLELFQKVLAEEDIELTSDDYYAHYLGFDDRGCFQAVLEAAGQPATPDRIFRLIARKSAYYQARARQQGFPTFAGAAELIRSTSDGGLTLGVVSGALRDEVEGALEQLGLRDRFKTLVTAEDVEVGKPDPEGYRRGLENLNVLPPLPTRLIHPHEVLAIEDSPAGLAAAAACGMSTLGVAQTYPAAELEAADQVVDSIALLDLARLRTLFAEAV